MACTVGMLAVLGCTHQHHVLTVLCAYLVGIGQVPVLSLPGIKRTLVIADTSGLHHRGYADAGRHTDNTDHLFIAHRLGTILLTTNDGISCQIISLTMTSVTSVESPGTVRYAMRLAGDNDGGLPRLDPWRMPTESAMDPNDDWEGQLRWGGFMVV